jgi:hypothetical protein
MNTKDLTALIHNGDYDPSEIILIGTHMKPWSAEDQHLEIGFMEINSDFASKLKLEARYPPNNGTKSQTPALALIYAYGYEGHSYRLPKPRIMIVNGPGEVFGSEQDNEGSAAESKLFRWRLSKDDKTISIEVQSDTLEKLVLEANKPGNRAVNSYGAHMQMSHRGGKLS